METHTAVAKIEGGKATVWISTQSPFPNREQIAKAIGFTPENVRVITPFVGGGFGGKNPALQAVEAEDWQKSPAAGDPGVEPREEFFYDTYRPAPSSRSSRASIVQERSACGLQRVCGRLQKLRAVLRCPNSVIRVYGQGMGGGAGLTHSAPVHGGLRARP